MGLTPVPTEFVAALGFPLLLGGKLESDMERG